MALEKFSDAFKHPFTFKSIEIHSFDKVSIVSAYVLGPLAIHDDLTHPYQYRITHIKTGLAVITSIKFRSAARRIVRELLNAEYCWNFGEFGKFASEHESESKDWNNIKALLLELRTKYADSIA